MCVKNGVFNDDIFLNTTIYSISDWTSMISDDYHCCCGYSESLVDLENTLRSHTHILYVQAHIAHFDKNVITSVKTYSYTSRHPWDFNDSIAVMECWYKLVILGYKNDCIVSLNESGIPG